VDSGAGKEGIKDGMGIIDGWAKLDVCRAWKGVLDFHDVGTAMEEKQRAR
jgi:hypothetical protein